MRQILVGVSGTLLFVGIAVWSGCSSYSSPNTGMGGGANQSGASNTQSGSGSGGAPQCTTSNVTACGGSVVGAFKVASSCLKLQGQMDTTLLSLGCPSVPVTGSLNVTGTFVARADGTYADNTNTSGSVTFPLATECL